MVSLKSSPCFKLVVFVLFFVLSFPLSAGKYPSRNILNSQPASAVTGNTVAAKNINPEGITGVTKKTIYGQNNGASFGYSVCSPGDVNGDGYDDVVIGEPNYSSGKGRVYIYLGPVKSNSVIITLTGETTGDNFGCSIAGAGDINGDGYADIIVGAKGYSGSKGRAYIYFGGSNPDATADVILTGENTGDNFGCSVGGNSDLNKDSYKDVVVGARYFNGNTGKAYVYYGGKTPDNAADVTFNGELTGNNFGCSVSGAGDINGDGYDDILIGACGFNSNSGRAYAFFGSAAMNAVPDIIFSGENSNDYFGISVALAGDVNGDEFSDLLIGASGYNASRGKAYLYKGGAVPDNTADLVMTGENAGDYFGFSVSSAGDFLNEGYSAVIVGAYGYNSGTGRSYVYYGGPVMNTVVDIVLTGEATNAYLGFCVSTGGDSDGDGFFNAVAGSYGTLSGKGGIQTVKYSSTETGDPTLTFSDATSGFGNGAASGDINGDGFDDILIGINGYSTNRGRVLIYLGGGLPDNAADLSIQGLVAGEGFGYAVCVPGDVNGDGFNDFLVSAIYNNTNAGKVYLFFGGAVLDTIPDVSFNGDVASGSLGVSICGAGDFNNDGSADIVIAYASSVGKANLYLGSAVMNNIVDGVFKGTVSTNYGGGLAGVGDVNGDSYDDIVIGQYSSTKAFLYLGGAVIDTAADLTFSESSLTGFGKTVGSAGDFNGDGFADVIIGAESYTTSTGRANIYYGGSTVNATADLSFTGEATSNYFGCSVGTIGDINKDGYDDLIISAWSYGFGLGRVYIYYGGSAADNTADIIRTGVSLSGPQSQLGRLTVMGDINGDGVKDFISSSILQNVVYYYQLSSPLRINPRITLINDVPMDEGGKVKIEWLRCGYDAVTSGTTISEYSVERSKIPDIFGYAWEQIASLPAHNNPKYAYTAATPNDSLSGGTNKYVFRITARTSDPAKYYRSNIVTGYSIDNLAPSTVQSFGSSIANGVTKLYWSPSREKDFKAYYLYRSAASSINPDSIVPLSITKDTFYLDAVSARGNIYYFVRSADVHGNFSPLSGNSNNPLPVEIDLLFARVTGLSVILNWRSVTEININEFVIERKNVKSSVWEQVGREQAAGNSSAVHNYTFTDAQVEPGTYLYRLVIKENDGYCTYSQAVSATVGVPQVYSLAQNFPNPFNPETVIGFTLPHAGNVQLDIYDMLGRKVVSAVNEFREAGYYSEVFKGGTAGSGVYVYVLKVNGYTFVKKMQLLK